MEPNSISSKSSRTKKFSYKPNGKVSSTSSSDVRNSISSKSSRRKKSSYEPKGKVSSSDGPIELMLFPVNRNPPSPSDSLFQPYIPVLSSSSDVSTELTMRTGSGDSCSSGSGSSCINSIKRKSISQDQEQGRDDHQYAKKPKLFEIAGSSPSSTSTSNIHGGMISEIDVANGLDLRLSLSFSAPPPPPPSHDHRDGGHDQERYNIRKTLENSDVNPSLGRLLLGIKLVESHVLCALSDREVENVKSGDGTKVMVRDMDEGSNHWMMFKKLPSSKSYVFNSDWTHQFLRRRQLRAGDTIGMYWDPEAKQFCFSVLRRAPSVAAPLLIYL